jgi:hypothetical protein
LAQLQSELYAYYHGYSTVTTLLEIWAENLKATRFELPRDEPTEPYAYHGFMDFDSTIGKIVTCLDRDLRIELPSEIEIPDRPVETDLIWRRRVYVFSTKDQAVDALEQIAMPGPRRMLRHLPSPVPCVIA